MRARVLALVVGVVGGAMWIARELRRRDRDREAQKIFQEEPVDAILLIEEYVDAEAFADIDAMVALGEQPGVEPGLAQADADEMYGSVADTSELYGSHGTAQDDDDRAQAHGENWVEALQESAIENGPEPEAILVFLDEVDLDPPTELRDRPIADRGSGGRGGV